MGVDDGVVALPGSARTGARRARRTAAPHGDEPIEKVASLEEPGVLLLAEEMDLLRRESPSEAPSAAAP